jgi:cephalosporin hydroxylase
MSAVGFRLGLQGRRSLYREYLRCRTTADFVEFAQRHFPGPFSQIPEEITRFLEYAGEKAPSLVSEIGTQFGGTNFLLSQAIPSVTRMVGVDLFVRNRSRLQTFKKPHQQIRLLNGSSQSEAMRRRVTAALGGAALDLLFIDGDHTWAGVVQDFQLYRTLVREGGLIAFHDIVPDNRLRSGTPTSAYAGEVPLLWARLKEHYSCREFVDSWDQEGCGIGVIEYDSGVVVPDELFVL